MVLIATSSIFTSVMKNSLQYRQIEPTVKKTTTKVTNPSIEGLSVTEATEKLTEIGLEADCHWQWFKSGESNSSKG